MGQAKKVVGYIRVSDDPQADLDRASLPEQERAIREYCQSKGYELVAIFSDVGRRWDANRPKFQRMIAFGKENPRPFDIIVVWRADRIVGSASTVAALEPLLDRGGVDIEGVVEPVRKEWLLLNALIAKGETEAKHHRGKLGVKTAVERGHYLGTPPYGRCLDKELKKVVANESEAYWYRQMFVWSIAGDGDEKIAKRLNGLGVPTRWQGKVTRTGRTIGKGWIRSYVRKLLTDPASYGEGRFQIKGGDSFRFPLPPVVDKPTFDQAQKARRARLNFGHRPTSREYLISPRKGKCSECGLGFRIVSRGLEVKRRTKNGEVKTYQRKVLSPTIICRGMHNYPHIHQCRKPKFIDFDKVQTVIVRRVAEVLSTEDFALACAAPDRSEVDRIAARLKESEHALEQTMREINFVVTEGRTGRIPKAVFDIQMSHLNEVLEHKQVQLNKIESEYKSAGERATRAEQVTPLVTCLKGFWETFKQITVVTGRPGKDDGLVGVPFDRTGIQRLKSMINILVEGFTVDSHNNITVDLSIPILQSIEENALHCRELCNLP